ncbi:hypothetical protein [Xanthocytophaga flava]|uniref:hypothetical protein n=1 Tax=Xanthocytophaga flava TaxID=3048013 RepID=UPI0028D4FC30|nr:hypothetical protein [Xanthocytophaga flavus]MDJ1472569.1 hypothetical protein [Xanthocytophaga flavus]
MKKDQIDRDIKAGKLSSKEFQLDTFRAVIVLSWLFVLTVAAVAIVVWDWLHSKQTAYQTMYSQAWLEAYS